MPGTITDDKSAIAHASNVAPPKYRARFKNLASEAADFGLRKLVIGGLAALLSICPAGIAEAKYVNLDGVQPACITCPDASRFLDLNGLVNSMYSGSPKQFITGRYDGCGWYRHPNTGDYLDKWWYYNLDEGQYYYLDRTQYKLLGGASYILGHPCYPKLFERSSEQAVGFTNRRRIYIPWYDCCWDYLTVSKSGLRQGLCPDKPVSLGNICIGLMPIDKYVIWHSCFQPGDNIGKLRYSYLDKGRYYILDEIQYKWIGGLAYEFERPYSRLLRGFKKEGIVANTSSIPEPATIGILGLGALGILILRNERRA